MEAMREMVRNSGSIGVTRDSLPSAHIANQSVAIDEMPYEHE